MSTALAAAPARRVGRFELLRELGRGAQGTVWLAHDERLDREVALKLLNPDSDPQALAAWLSEARAVGRLKHANVVPVFEADDSAGAPFLVFEYVEGPTLAEARRKRPAWPAREAAELVLGVLDALAAAHEQGIVHRDLKPSNILLGQDGRPRVMDFGIAARVAPAANGPDAAGRPRPRGRAQAEAGAEDPTAGRIVGTPGYISPEAARGEPPDPVMDVFAAGVLLGELLAGAPLLRETDPYRAIARVQREDLRLPPGLEVDDRLRGIVQQALARDRKQRYETARAMHTALAAWLQPAATPAAGSGNGTLDFLLRRIRHKSDFPALSQSVLRIQRVASSDRENLSTLSHEVMQDVALTNKLLRMVNTAQFRHVLGEGVSTISRAVALVGFAGIRNMALTLVLLEHMQDKQHAQHLRGEFLRALMAGTLAGELAPPGRDGEEAYLGSMFQNLGRLLTEYYFPEEALQVRQRLKSPLASHTERDAIAAQVLGLGFEDLGVGVAKSWGLPETLQRAMRPPAGEPPGQSLPRGAERLRWLGRGANALTDAMLSADGDAQARALAEAAELYGPALGFSARELLGAAQESRQRLSTLSQAMGLHVPSGSPERRLLSTHTGEPVPGGEALGASPSDGLAAGAAAANGHPAGDAAARARRVGQVGQVDGRKPADPSDAPTAVLPREGLPSEAPAGPVSTAGPGEGQERGGVQYLDSPIGQGATGAVRLAGGLQALSSAVTERKLPLNEVLRLAMETLQAAIGLQRVLLALRDPARDELVGRFAIGEGAAGLKAAFRVPLGKAGGPDLFAMLCAKGADTLIADASQGTIAARLPAWYRQQINAPTFLLLPLMLKGKPLGILYGDHDQAGRIKLAEHEMALVRALRDQVLGAFHNAGAG
jgi:eukaryotic-like serine/threonine-protein kinase